MLYLSIISYILSGASFIAAIVMFFMFNILHLRRDLSGSLEQRQIEEIRVKNFNDARQRGKINVFEDLEKRAKPRTGSTSGLKLRTLTGEKPVELIPSSDLTDPATTVLQQSVKAINANFLIEKNIMFVSTSEVI